MAIPEIGIKAAIGAGSAAAVATPATLGVIYKDEIAKFMGSSEAPKSEIQEEDAETKRINDKLKDLGISDKCNFTKGNSFKDCNGLTLEEVKKINFLDKGTNEDLSMAPAGTFSLKIEKEANKTNFPDGLKFSFTASTEVKIKPTTGNEKPFLIANEKTEFKIKTEGNKSKLEKIPVKNAGLTQLNERINSLGFPNDKCRFTADGSPTECEITGKELKNVKFDGTSTGEDSKKFKLKIEKVVGNDFPENLKFTFSSTETNAQEYGNEPNKISVKSGETNIFKIKKVSQENKLEKVWTIEKLGEKVGLTCTKGSNSEKKCVHKSNGTINVWKSNGDKIENATGMGTSGELTFIEDSSSNHGFKITANQNIDLTVSGATGKKIEAGSYEIKYQSDNK